MTATRQWRREWCPVCNRPAEHRGGSTVLACPEHPRTGCEGIISNRIFFPGARRTALLAAPDSSSSEVACVAPSVTSVSRDGGRMEPSVAKKLAKPLVGGLRSTAALPLSLARAHFLRQSRRVLCVGGSCLQILRQAEKLLAIFVSAKRPMPQESAEPQLVGRLFTSNGRLTSEAHHLGQLTRLGGSLISAGSRPARQHSPKLLPLQWFHSRRHPSMPRSQHLALRSCVSTAGSTPYRSDLIDTCLQPGVFRLTLRKLTVNLHAGSMYPC